MADLDTIRRRLENYIIARGLSFREISLKIGRKDSYIQQYIKYGFPKRLNEIDRKKTCQLLDIDEKELIDDELLMTSSDFTPFFENEKIANDTQDFVNIDVYSPYQDGDVDGKLIGRMRLNFKEFYAWGTGNPYKLNIMRLDGDYMEPTITNGALIVFDFEQKSFTGDGIYVIKTDTAIQIKRLQKLQNDSYILHADNPRYQDIKYTKDEITILGRAVYCLSGRTL